MISKVQKMENKDEKKNRAQNHRHVKFGQKKIKAKRQNYPNGLMNWTDET